MTKRTSYLWWAAIALALLLLMVGCADEGLPQTAPASEGPASVDRPADAPADDAEEVGGELAMEMLAAEAPAVSHTPWSEADSPNYYRVLGAASVGEIPEPGTISYGELDGRGRATGAVACVTYDSMMAGRSRVREGTTDIEPTGWGHNQEVDMAMPDGSVYHGLLFNRSHLVAKSLGGEEVAANLITGTRTQNVGANVNGSEGGMAYAEALARDWLEAHPEGTVYFAATPVYEGTELLARSVIVDVRTSDRSVDQRVEVYNAARGFEIDYATGEFSVTEDAREAAEEIRSSLGLAALGAAGAVDEERDVAAAPVLPIGSSASEGGERKVIITGSGRAYHHDETCRGLSQARSMRWVTVSEAEAMGRRPCKICGG